MTAAGLVLATQEPGNVTGQTTSISPVLLSIPSPSTGTLELGPLTLHMYGLTLLVAIAACIWLTGLRWVAARRRLGSGLPRAPSGASRSGSSARAPTTC